MNEKEKENLITKINFYKQEGIEVHVVKLDDWFYNGYILEIFPDYFILHDRKANKVIVLINEIKNIEPTKKLEGKR
jgi:hypothetical protein